MDTNSPRNLGSYGPIEVFRAGTFSPMGMGPETITTENLREIAATYDPEVAPAPVVIGHPQLDAPAFGWVDQLYVADGVLKATLKDTAAEFADMVKAGRYKRVSVSLFTPKSTANPKPGSLYLKHVGFLGATAPAVPGLKPVKFASDDGSLWFAQDKSGATASAKPDLGDELARLRRQVQEQEVEQLVAAGRLLPVFKEEVAAFAASLDDHETVSFADGATATRKDWFMSFLGRQPQVVSFGAMDLGCSPFDGAPGRRVQNIPDGYQPDRSHDDLLAAAHQLVREKGVSFSDAVDMALEGQR